MSEDSKIKILFDKYLSQGYTVVEIAAMLVASNFITNTKKEGQL
jgi:hypothetical protein